MTGHEIGGRTSIDIAEPDVDIEGFPQSDPDAVGLARDRYVSNRPTAEQSCPPWCMDAHIDERPDERIHTNWIQAVDLHAIPLAGLPQRLWLDLVLGPGDDEPRIHLQIDDRAVIELTIAEARNAGTHLIGLAALAVMETPPV